MSSSNYETKEDPRFALTDWERESVKRLKAECDLHNIQYNSLFELAKYVLVVKSSVEGHSEVDEAKRLSLAFDRIKGRREWERKMGMDSVDPQQALLDYEVTVPGLLIPQYEKDHDGHVVLAFSKLQCNPEAVNERKAESYAGLLFWYDLAAADMSEARRGIAVASMVPDDKENVKKSSWNYIRTLTALKDAVKPIHNHRIRRIYSVAPFAMRALIDLIKKMLPRKLRDRMLLFPTQAALDEVLYRKPENRSLNEWVSARLEIYNETVEKLSL